MYGYVYMTTCLVNNKKYIGQHKSSTLDMNYKGSGKALWNAINKYGKENFSVELLKECNSREELNKMEAFYIEKYNADKDRLFYNITPGKGQGSGTNSPMYGKRGKDNPNYGSKRTEEQRRHISESKLGNQSLLGKIAVNNGKRNRYIELQELDKYLQNGWRKGVKPFSEQMKSNISKGVKESLKNPETIRKKSENMKGNTYGIGNKSTKGKIGITNGCNNTFIFPEELNVWTLKGYYKGITRKKVIE